MDPRRRPAPVAGAEAGDGDGDEGSWPEPVVKATAGTVARGKQGEWRRASEQMTGEMKKMVILGLSPKSLLSSCPRSDSRQRIIYFKNKICRVSFNRHSAKDILFRVSSSRHSTKNF